MAESSNKRTCLRPRPSRVAPAPRFSPNIVRTVDGLPVFNIAVENLPKLIRRSVVADHFGKFGAIKNIDITYGRTRSKPAQCTVCFRATSGAASALKRRTQKLAGERVTVRACPSWEQPFQIDGDYDDDIDVHNNNNSNNQTGDVTRIIQLNDYCLELIFQYLELRDQVRLSLCHPRLEQVFVHMICPRTSRHLKIDALLTFSLWETRQYFRTAGPFVRSIESSSPVVYAYERRLLSNEPDSPPQCIFDLMREHCAQRVQKLRVLRGRSVFARYLAALQLRNITELELYDCDVKDADVLQLRGLTSLRVLGLGCNRNISGQHLSRLRSVERLSLCTTPNVTHDSLVAIMQALRLRYLDVRSCYFLESSGVFEHGNDLETLRVSCIGEGNVNLVAKLPKLKALESPLTSINFYRALHAQHANDLEELKVTGGPYAIVPAAQFKNLRILWLSDNTSKESLKQIATLSELEELNIQHSSRIRGDHVLPVVQHCTKLKRLGLRCCRHINDDFVMATILLLEQRKTPLLMLVGGTRVKKDVLKCSSYLNARHLLELSFSDFKPQKGLINDETEFDVPHGRYDDHNLQAEHNSQDWSEDSSVEEDEYDDADDDDDDVDVSSEWSSDSSENVDIFFFL